MTEGRKEVVEKLIVRQVLRRKVLVKDCTFEVQVIRARADTIVPSYSPIEIYYQ